MVFWNILHGGGPERLPLIALELLEQDADVIGLCEFRACRGGSLRGVLYDHGYADQVALSGPEGGNGLLLASRVGLDRSNVGGARDGRDFAGVLSAIAGDGTRITIAHVPAKGVGAARTARNLAWRRLLGVAREHAGDRHVIVGDLNCTRHRLDEPGATCRDPAMLGRISSLGYDDAFASRRREYSWVSHRGTAYRLDHAFCSRAVAGGLTGAEYARSPMEQGLSDHALVRLEVDPGG